jgi:hypothetical protein
MTFNNLESLGREQLSSSFFMREFLHSEISQITKTPNIPHFPKLAIKNGRRLCEDILEPIQDKLGRLSIRSGYRSPEVNALGAANKNRFKCASNKNNYAGHIWDYPDENGHFGASACILVPSYLEYYKESGDWKTLANQIKSIAPLYSGMTFHPKLCALNISWHDKPRKKVWSYIRARA